MDKDIYKLAKDFPNLWSIMENIKPSSYQSITGNCKSFGEGKFQNFLPEVEKICEKVEDYTQIIESQHRHMITDSKSSCIYLYYWLYYYNSKKHLSDEVKSLYKELMNSIDSSHRYICSENIYTTITDDVMSKFKDLDDMYTKLEKEIDDKKCEYLQECANIYGNYVQTCKYNNKTYFCDELLNIKEQYDKQMMSNICNPEIPQTLPSFQSYNVTTLTLIPIFATLAIFFFIFILYKFTPYNSRFRCTVMKKRKKCNNIDKERNILELSEKPCCHFRNNGYQILYNSN
ncbi:variable surface protein [Plasmodium gonderi]|uniref:Variable surface protein n=1 Tax=Plasmodium gonderi TaxID=77519 RepID=A0A1Y1JQM3_PLAGO|nr:variable surface protein [Plasmodium gonderi]GAW84510.1 variable surface protein [Plasmodium gonderi]